MVDRWEFERMLWARGVREVAGVDEAGRGPLAGPVVVGAVVLPEHWGRHGLPSELDGLNDSKQVPEPRRNRYFAFLMACDEVRRGIAIVESEAIDALNILAATHQGMSQALEPLMPAVEHVLVDGTPVHTLRQPQTAIVKGDARSYSIAAASILAKVTRDRILVEQDARWPDYGFAIHKGYPTAMHLAALARFGPCPIHRRSFGPVRRALETHSGTNIVRP